MGLLFDASDWLKEMWSKGMSCFQSESDTSSNASATSRSTVGLSFGRGRDSKEQSAPLEVSSPVLTESKRDVTNPISLFGSSFKQERMGGGMEMTGDDDRYK